MDGRQPPADEGARQASAQRPPLAGNGDARRGLVTFLFADIRGFTRYTGTHGAEAAARLANDFLSLASEVVERRGGRVRGTWGDQVLAEFDSPREAVRAAVEIQTACLDRTLAQPADPLPVGIGVDIGEPADDGPHQSAAALNVAARLCSHAAAGEALASPELVHLTGAMDGVAYVERRATRFKGLAGPTRVIEIRHVAVDQAQQRRFHAIIAPRQPLRGRPVVIGVALLLPVLLVAAVAGTLAIRDDGDPVTIPAGGLAVVDGGSGRVVDSVTVGGSPEGMSAGRGGDIWVAQAGTDSVARIDRTSGQVVRSVSVGRIPVAVAHLGRDVWVANSREGTVTRVSTVTNRVVDEVPVGNQPTAVAAGFGSVWVANAYDATVTRIDADTGRVLGRVQVGRGPSGVAAGAGAVWVTNSRDGTVSVIDPRTLDTAAPVQVGAGPRGIAVARSGVWVTNRLELTVTRIDPRTRRVLATIPVGDSPFGVAAKGDTVWVGASADGTLVEIDALRNVVTQSVNLGASPYGVVLVGDRAWTATRPFASAGHFGGTLRIVAEGVADSVDPVLGISSSELSMVYDGLTGFRRAGGADNFDVAPNLADALPQPTDGGRTYTFRLRPDIRYSDGRLVRPGDFRRGLERTFIVARAAGYEDVLSYFDKILGVAACRAPRSSCDLSAGIETDRSTVRFHLTEPDPDFPSKLPLRFAAPVPPGTPMTEQVSEVPPGTGPYMVAAFTPGKSLRLERNPHFRAWSVAVHPAGYPDSIQWSTAARGELISSVEAGRADATHLYFTPPKAADAVRVRRPAQVHRDSWAFTAWVVLDTTRPPFDKVIARQAVAWALDRAHFAELARQPADQAACTLPPPGFPGYEPRCPFTTRRDQSGTWWGADLSRGRRLVERSRTKGMRVDVVWPLRNNPGFAATGRYTTRLLRRLGYDAQFRATEGFVLRPSESPPRLHVSALGWYPDYLAPGAFYLPLLSCETRNSYTNLGQYCNRSLDALAARALEVSESDPGEADRLWRLVYRTIIDEAVIVPATHQSQDFLVSERLGNYQFGAFVGPLWEQMWVR